MNPGLQLQPRRFQDRAKGFTLLEVLLATAIFAIVLIAINTVFFSVLHLRRSVTEAIDESLPVNQALALLRRDLQNAVTPGGVLAGNFRVGGPAGILANLGSTGTGTTRSSSVTGSSMLSSSGMGNSQSGGLDFFTSTGVIRDEVPWGDIQEVNYQLVRSDRSDALGQDLVRGVTRNLLTYTTQTPETQRLVGDIQDLQFEFYDGTQWRDTWDTTAGDTGLPIAVRVSILPAAPRASVRREPIVMVVLLNSTGATNAVASTATEGSGQ